MQNSPALCPGTWSVAMAFWPSDHSLTSANFLSENRSPLPQKSFSNSSKTYSQLPTELASWRAGSERSNVTHSWEEYLMQGHRANKTAVVP